MKTVRDGLAVIGFIFILLVIWVKVSGQDKPDFKLSDNQTLRLKVKQLEFVNAQEHYQSAVASFNVEIQAVEKEKGWTETDVQFHPDTLTFTEVPKQPKPEGQKKPSLDKPSGPPVEPATKKP